MSGYSGPLGYFDHQENKLVTIKDTILKGNYNRPKNFLEFEKKYPNRIFIWGVENPDELFLKITSQDTEKTRLFVGLLIYSTMNTFCYDQVRDCFHRLKVHDVELYNSFGDEILKDFGLSSSKWWKFW
jgi:hypothetical protein